MDNAKKTSGTCQACFRLIALKGERMVHHGYERPGHGYIVGDCWGVGAKPYELDVSVTKTWLAEVSGGILPRLRAREEEVKTCTVLERMVTDYVRGYVPGTSRRYMITVTYRKGEKVTDRNAVSWASSFESARDYMLRGIRQSIEDAERLAKELTKRVAEWKYAPEKLVKTERKGATVHDPDPRFTYAPVCRRTIRSTSGHAVIAKTPSETTCARCLARRRPE